jgi:hypothetical protein
VRETELINLEELRHVDGYRAIDLPDVEVKQVSEWLINIEKYTKNILKNKLINKNGKFLLKIKVKN